MLGLPLYPWQDRAIAPLAEATGPNARRVNIAVRTPNGAGKDDRIIAGAVHYWLQVHPRGTVVITTKSDLQLSQQTIPAIERHRHKFASYNEPVYSPRYELTTKTGGRCVAFVTNNASRVEGWHKSDDSYGPLLLIVNEAKSVDEAIFQGLDRCTPNAVMLLSSPGLMMGRFFETFTKLKTDWINVVAGLVDCPHIPKERIEYIRTTYGENHPITRSTLYGEFMEQDDADQYLVSLTALHRCIESSPKHEPGLRAAFCDFGVGASENVIALREGNKVTIPAAWRQSDKEAAAGRFIREFRKLALKPEDIWCDAADKEMADLLAAGGFPIHRQNFGGPARQKETYKSWSAEAWHETAFAIQRGEIILPNDDVLFAQLTTRKKTITPTGKLAVEEKYEMAKPPRNLPSPDRADAVCGVMCLPEYTQAAPRFIDVSRWREGAEQESYVGTLEAIGASAGL